MPVRPFSYTITGVSSTSGDIAYWFPDVTSPSQFAVSVGCVVSSTTVAYTLSHTYDSVTPTSTVAPASYNWFTSTGITAAATSAYTSYLFPVTGLRVASTGGSSIGTVTVKIVQSG